MLPFSHPFHYAKEKFTQAVYTLATGPGRIKERLGDAFLSFMTIMMDKLPPGEIRDDYQRLYEALTRVKAKGPEGHVAATLAEMTEDQAAELAKLICEIEAKLSDAVR